MKISTKGRYALRLMADIGAHDQSGCVSLRDVAARQEISVKYLEQIAGMLTKAGFLYSERYRAGSPDCRAAVPGVRGRACGRDQRYHRHSRS